MIILREAQIQIYKTLFVAVIILKGGADTNLYNVVRISDNSKRGAVQFYKTLFVAVIILREAQYKFIKRCS